LLVPVCRYKSVTGIAENVQKIARSAFRAGLLVELTCARSDDFSESQKLLDGFETRILTTNRRFPAVDGDKLDAKLSACVPATVESFECLHRVVSIFILDINVPAKMRLVVAANFELGHAADSLKFRNNVLVKFSAK